jgi:hypothetical protein
MKLNEIEINKQFHRKTDRYSKSMNRIERKGKEQNRQEKKRKENECHSVT